MQNPLNESSLAFPLLGSVHLFGILCGVGAAALVNFRLLGVQIGGSGPARLWSETRLLTLGGLALAIFSGFLLFSIAPAEYITSAMFCYKMAALAAALVFHYTLVRRAAARDAKAPVVAVIALALYALVPLGGILIGYE
jgi:hypothetical protein